MRAVLFPIAAGLARLNTDRRAVTALEYGLIAGVLVVTITIGFNVLGNGLESSFTNIAETLT